MFKKIMLALDGTTLDDGALRCAADLAGESSGEVVVIHVTELIGGRGSGPMHLDEPDRLANVRREVRSLAREGIATELEVHSTIVDTAADVIAAAARRAGADVIVTGSADHGRLRAALVGSVPRKLVRVAPCPVLTVRGERAPIAA